MAIRAPQGKPSINLDGPDGNAFVLLGYAKRFAEQLGLDWNGISADMRSGDYEHLIEVFDRHFGDVVDLVRTPPDEDEDDG
jgi:hypothetical protein